MTRSHVFEHQIIQGSGVPLAYGTEIPTHDPGKAGEFRDVKPRPMWVQLLEVKGMVKNPWHFLALPVLQTQIRIVDFSEEILGMTAIGFPDQGSGFLLVTGSEIGNAEMISKRGNLGVGRD